MSEDLRELYARYIDMLNARELDRMHEFAHDNVIFNDEPTTRDEYVAAISGHLDAVPNFRWNVEDLIIEGDRVAVRLVDDGTPEKEWLGLQPTGARVKVTEYAFYHFRDGRFDQMWYLLDKQGVARALEEGAKA